MKKLSKCPNTKSGKHYLDQDLVNVEEPFRDPISGNDMYKCVREFSCQFCDYSYIDDSENLTQRKNPWLVGSDRESEIDEVRQRNSLWWKIFGEPGILGD